MSEHFLCYFYLLPINAFFLFFNYDKLSMLYLKLVLMGLLSATPIKYLV